MAGICVLGERWSYILLWLRIKELMMSVVVICVCLFYIIPNANTDIPQVKAPARMYYDTIWYEMLF